MPNYEIRSIKKAGAVLSAFSSEYPDLRVAEIVRIVGFNRSVVQKIVVTLQTDGFLEQDPMTHRYRIGNRIAQIAHVFLSGNALAREGMTVVRDLVHASGMSASVGVLEGTEVLYLVALESEAGLKATSRPGDRRPLHATATGKCILAFLREEEREALLARIKLVSYTPHTFSDPQGFRRELKTIASQGYALNREERILGLAGVAAPVWNLEERVVGAIGLAMPKHSLVAASLGGYVELTLRAARLLSTRLGSARTQRAGDMSTLGGQTKVGI